MNLFTKRIGEYLDGKPYTHNGISGRILYVEYPAFYPYRHTAQSIVHEADEAGKQTEAYQETKRTLGDDWDSDLTDSESLVDIAVACGMTEEMILA